jgi:toxin ParE1/3/4
MGGRRRTILISPEAYRDLIDIWAERASATSPDKADDRLREIDRVCARLVDDVPLEGRGREELASGLLSIFHHPDVIFYRATEASIEIVRTIHYRRDIEAIFDPRD